MLVFGGLSDMALFATYRFLFISFVTIFLCILVLLYPQYVLTSCLGRFQHLQVA